MSRSMCVFAYNLDYYAFCWTSMHTHPLSGVINQILSSICNHLHLHCLLYVCLAVWMCVCVCVSHLHHLEYRSVCKSMLRHRGGPPKNTDTFKHPPQAATHISHTHTHRFMCSLLTVITVYISHLCSRVCYMLGGVCVSLYVSVCVCTCVAEKEILISGWREPQTFTLCTFFCNKQLTHLFFNRLSF